MDGVDGTDGHFFYNHCVNANSHDGLAGAIADYREAWFFTHQHDPWRSAFYKLADKRLYTPGLVGFNRSGTLVGISYICCDADHCDALGLGQLSLVL